MESQFRENELVLKELKLLKPGSKVYKQIGPALILQEQVEATSNIEKRIDFIKTEMYDNCLKYSSKWPYLTPFSPASSKRVEVLIKESEEKQEKKRDELIKMQQEMQKNAKKQ